MWRKLLDEMVKGERMTFVIDEALKAHMEHTGKRNVVVEVVTAETSDIEITELHVYLTDDKQAKILKERKRYRGQEIDGGEVLLPPFPLQYEEEVRFWLKKAWIFKMVGYAGVKV